MKKIIISEKHEIFLYQSLVNEETSYLGDKEDVVIKWLNDHFKAMENEVNDEMGLPKIDKVVSILDTNKQLTKNIIPIERVYYMMQAQFKNILHDKKDRNQFLWDTLKKWYN